MGPMQQTVGDQVATLLWILADPTLTAPGLEAQLLAEYDGGAGADLGVDIPSGVPEGCAGTDAELALDNLNALVDILGTMTSFSAYITEQTNEACRVPPEAAQADL